MSKIWCIFMFCIAFCSVQQIKSSEFIENVVDLKGKSSFPRTKNIQTAFVSSSTYLTQNQIELFRQSLQFIQNVECQRDLNATLWGLISGAEWATSMFDASVREAVGIESGILYQFGHYEQCLKSQISTAVKITSQSSSSTDEEAAALLPIVQSKYCLVDVPIEGLNIQNTGSRRIQPQPSSTLSSSSAAAAAATPNLDNLIVTHWGVCVPATCLANDIAIYLQHTLQRNVTVNDKMCQLSNHELHITDGMFIYATVMLFFIFLAILSTSYHIYLISSKREEKNINKTMARNETLNMALLSFSIIENVKKLFQASKDQLGLNSINGIKALAMLFILAGHALTFIYSSSVYNVEFLSQNIKSPVFAFLSNSLLFVDVFLLLSGFLFCRILLIELERRQGKLNVLVLYFGRYIRLTPAYLAIIGFYLTWFPSLGSGPLWHQRIVREQERCQESWWLNILYINNYIHSDKLCMFQSWYLSVDSQMFFIAPICIYLLNKSRKYGMRLLAALVAITSVIPFVVTYVRKLDPTLMVYPSEVEDLTTNSYYRTTYIKTHMRASAYVIGLLTGYLVHLIQAKGTKFPKLLVRALWLISITVGISSMYTISRFYVHSFNNMESTMYAGFHKIGWNFSVAWLVLAVTTGHAGGLQKVLSSRVFAPISRLTYCAYLSNGIVELYHSSSVKSQSYLGYIHLTDDIFSHTLNTFLLAILLCLLFESPIHALERILMRTLGGHKPKKSQTNGCSNNKDNQTPSTSEEQIA